jgi:hypothetical protein
MMTQLRLRMSAWPSRRKSRSPAVSAAAVGLWLAGAGFEAALRTAVLSTAARPYPARQNAKRITHSAHATIALNKADYTPLRLRLG